MSPIIFENTYRPGIGIPSFRKRRRCSDRTPGILDRIQQCETQEQAASVWSSFIDGGATPSQKTANKAQRLISRLP